MLVNSCLSAHVHAHDHHCVLLLLVLLFHHRHHDHHHRHHHHHHHRHYPNPNRYYRGCCCCCCSVFGVRCLSFVLCRLSFAVCCWSYVVCFCLVVNPSPTQALRWCKLSILKVEVNSGILKAFNHLYLHTPQEHPKRANMCFFQPVM